MAAIEETKPTLQLFVGQVGMGLAVQATRHAQLSVPHHSRFPTDSSHLELLPRFRVCSFPCQEASRGVDVGVIVAVIASVAMSASLSTLALACANLLIFP